MRGAQPWKTNRARVLRSNETGAEQCLWSELRGGRFRDLKFVRQLPLGPYFVDFACRSKKVIVEIDGGTHSTCEELMSVDRRQRYLEQLGYQVFRVSNVEVYENMDGVLDLLLEFVEACDA